MKIDELKQEILSKPVPETVAIILDGNGRWAKKRGLPRTMGHAKGIENLVSVSTLCKEIGVKNLLVYAFSTENWSRPKEEVDYLMKALVDNLAKYRKRMMKNQTKVKILGQRSNLSSEVLAAINDVESATAHFSGYTLGICFNYGGQQEIVKATKELCEMVKNGEIAVEDINKEVFEQHLYTKGIPAVDLLIRTSGEIRLSNFLPWQLAYSEFVFADVHWPDFNKKELYLAISKYQSRNRRFGGLENKNVK